MFACMAISSVLLIGCSNASNGISNAVKENTPADNPAKVTVLSNSLDSTNWKPTEFKTVNNFNGVTLTLKKETLSDKGLTVIFQNKSDKLCTYGEHFWLEKKINDKWYQVPVSIKDNYAFTDIGYSVASGQESEWKVNWNWLYGSLDAGEYRIIKNALDFRKTGDYSTYFLTAEFTITN
jgi:hypothetical protein